MVKRSFEQVLDTCLTQLNSGADLEAVIGGYPEFSDELRPLLAAAAWARIEIPPPRQRMVRKQAFLTRVAKRRRLVEMVEGYVVELKAGVPFAELLDRASSEMKPVLVAAWRMHTTVAPEPSAERKAADKARLMAMAEARRAARPVERRSWLPNFDLAGATRRLMPVPLVRHPALARSVVIAAAVVVMMAGASGLQIATASSLPGEPFYHAKRLGESAQLLFAFNQPAQRAELYVRFTEQRFAEIRALSAEGREIPVYLVEDWLRLQTRAWSDIQKLAPEERELLMRQLLATSRAGQQLDELRDAVEDSSALGALLSRSEALHDSVRASSGEGDGIAPVELPNLAPKPVPLPPEDTEPPDEAPPQAAQPLAPPVVEPAAPPAAEPDPVVQPGVAVRGGDDEDDEDEPRGAGQPPADPPAVATDEPPPEEPIFGSMPVATATPDPDGPQGEPPADPQPPEEPPADPPPSNPDDPTP